MGQTVSVEEEGDLEDDEDGVVDLGQLNKLKAELKAAHAQLEVKEEQVVKLSKIRDEVEAELEELTASLFQVKQSDIVITIVNNLTFRRQTDWLLMKWQRELMLKRPWRSPI